MKRLGQDARTRILNVAEDLFSRNGFDGATVDSIAKAAGVNKALIYYYFKDKDDIIVSLFRNIVEELEDHVERNARESVSHSDEAGLGEKIQREIEFLGERKEVLSVMLMEALKDGDRHDFLFKCAEIVMSHRRRAYPDPEAPELGSSSEAQADLVHEFFTGFIPVIAFVVFKDKWSRYFQCDVDGLSTLFVDAFERSHLASHRTGR